MLLIIFDKIVSVSTSLGASRYEKKNLETSRSVVKGPCMRVKGVMGPIGLVGLEGGSQETASIVTRFRTRFIREICPLRDTRLEDDFIACA